MYQDAPEKPISDCRQILPAGANNTGRKVVCHYRSSASTAVIAD